MRYRLAVGLSLMMLAGGVLAQDSTPATPSTSAQSSAPLPILPPAPASDDWSADRAGAGDVADATDADASSKEIFKFKERKTPDYVEDGPGNAVNREQVLGTDKQGWKDGRPPVDCTRPPFSPACNP